MVLVACFRTVTCGTKSLSWARVHMIMCVLNHSNKQGKLAHGKVASFDSKVDGWFQAMHQRVNQHITGYSESSKSGTVSA